MELESHRLASRVARVRRSLKPGDPFPHELRRAVVQWAEQQRAAGCTWRQISGPIGLSSTSIRSWMDECSQPSGFQQLEVVGAAAEAAAGPGLRLTTPSGYVVSGGSVEELARLLVVLG